MRTIIQARGASFHALFLMAFCIAMMVVDHRFQHLEVVRSNVSLAISPLRYLVSLPATAGNWLGDWFTSHTELLEENERLRAEGRILNARLQKFEILAEENSRLRSLLGSARKIADDVIVIGQVGLKPDAAGTVINGETDDAALAGTGGDVSGGGNATTD